MNKIRSLASTNPVQDNTVTSDQQSSPPEGEPEQALVKPAISFVSRRHEAEGDAIDSHDTPAERKPAGKKPGPNKGKQGPKRQGGGKGNAGQQKKRQANKGTVVTPIPKARNTNTGPEASNIPYARPAQMKKRHWSLLVSFLVMVLVPLAAVVSYLFVVAEEQYSSTAGFTVRSQEESGANELLGGLAQFVQGSAVASDSDILYEFIQSQEMVKSVNARFDLREHYSQNWPNDWFFSIWPDASQEELIWYWNRIVSVSYDSATGLIEVQTKAFDPLTAQKITEIVVDESQKRINALNEAARQDAMRYAIQDLEEAVELLKTARRDLTEFRTRSQIVDPETDIQTRMGVMNSLQQDLAEALVEYDLLQGSTTSADPRLSDTQQRIEVIRKRIEIERTNFASSSTETGGVEQDYPTLIAEFERLTVDREYAQQYYFASLTAMETARDAANRESLYLARYITPTLAETAEFPKRYILSALVGLFLLLLWSIIVMIYYSIRDKS